MKYKQVTAGGTFDHFHKGHVAILEKAFSCGEIVWIGVTTQSYFSNKEGKSAKKFPPLEEYSIRQDYLEQWLKEKDFAKRANIVPINDRYGTTLKNERMEAIIVSPDTELVATEINLLRAQKNWPALDVHVIPWVLARDGSPISSKRIRAGEIDRQGEVFRLPENWGIRKLPETIRQDLKKPLGELFKETSRNHEQAVKLLVEKIRKTTKKTGKLISVGDAVTDALLKEEVFPDVSIIDLKIARQPVYKNVSELGFRDIKLFKTVDNAAGTISYAAYIALLELISSEAKPAVLHVVGEEDLLTLLAIFLAPLNSLIVYGQPNEGVVVVTVNEEKKLQAKHFLNQFIPE